MAEPYHNPSVEEALLGRDLFGDPVKPKAQAPLADRFGVPVDVVNKTDRAMEVAYADGTKVACAAGTLLRVWHRPMSRARSGCASWTRSFSATAT